MANRRTPKFEPGDRVKMRAYGSRFKYNIVKECRWDEELNDYVYGVQEMDPLRIYRAKQLLHVGDREYDILLEHYRMGKAKLNEQGWLIDVPRKRKKRKKVETDAAN